MPERDWWEDPSGIYRPVQRPTGKDLQRSLEEAVGYSIDELTFLTEERNWLIGAIQRTLGEGELLAEYDLFRRKLREKR